MTAVRPACTVVRIEDVPVRDHGDEPALPAGGVDLRHEISLPVNQGLCGSCWSITTTQCLRDRLLRVRRQRGVRAPLPPLSFQFVMDCACTCVTYKGRRGCALDCDGGFMVTAYHFLSTVGTPREGLHPSRHDNGQNGADHVDAHQPEATAPRCPPQLPPGEPLYRCGGYYHLHLYDTFGITNARTRAVHLQPDQLRRNADNIAREILLHGPVSVCFNLFSDFRDFWDHPRSGDMVYQVGWLLPPDERAQLVDPVGNVDWTAARPGPRGLHFKTGHSVSLVGFGTTADGVDYWICRNSWGRPANNRGYFRIRRGINASAIEGDVCAPDVDHLQLAATPVPAAAPAPPLPLPAPAKRRTATATGASTERRTTIAIGATLCVIVFLVAVWLVAATTFGSAAIRAARS